MRNYRRLVSLKIALESSAKKIPQGFHLICGTCCGVGDWQGISSAAYLPLSCEPPLSLLLQNDGVLRGICLDKGACGLSIRHSNLPLATDPFYTWKARLLLRNTHFLLLFLPRLMQEEKKTGACCYRRSDRKNLHFPKRISFFLHHQSVRCAIEIF